MKIENLEYNGKGIFNYIEQTGLLPFLTSDDATTLDQLLLTYYGGRDLSISANRIIGGVINDVSLSKLSGVVLIEYRKKWFDTEKLLQEELTGTSYNLKETSTLTKTGTQAVETTTESNRNNKESVTGFNDLGFIDDTKQETSDSDGFTSTGNNEDVQELIKETIGNTTSRLSELWGSLKYIQNNQLYDIMIKDVLNSVGNYIY